MSFWNIRLDDELNDRIWKESVEKGNQLRGESTCEFGAQQAMLASIPECIRLDENNSLPWVPDLVGKKWKSKEAVLVVGSAYAGFIRQYSPRKKSMCLCDYASAKSAAEFQQRFLTKVVEGDDDYYEKIAKLLVKSGVAAGHLVIFDLCRACFVKRGNKIALRKDKSGDGVAKAAPGLFEKYVQANSSWTWERILGTNAQIIVALGTIAEHGLLRLFAKELKNCKVGVHEGDETLDVAKMKSDSSSGWIKKYADSRLKLSFWKTKQTWWHITGNADGIERDWKLLPVYHPARSCYDPEYESTSEVLAKARRLCSSKS